MPADRVGHGTDRACARKYPLDVLCSFCSSPGNDQLPSVKDCHCQGRMAEITSYEGLDACVYSGAGDLYRSGIAVLDRRCVDDVQGIYKRDLELRVSAMQEQYERSGTDMENMLARMQRIASLIEADPDRSREEITEFSKLLRSGYMR
ncbi:MAG: hypothetical protein J0H07_04410 [Sphingobacteriales bacterium]|nr:hypothetical protein [Sphingobacteriales bacterium]